MKKSYSTCIIPERSELLLFSIKSEAYLYHCWMNEDKGKFVLIKESNEFSILTPNQILNFTEISLKKYLFAVTSKLKRIDELLFFNDALWNQYFISE